MNIQVIDCYANLMRAILWQYDNAEALKRIIRGEHEFINRVNCQFWNDFYRDVFNLPTANEFGLAIWSRILDIPLQLEVQPQPDKIAWGFGPFRKNFNNGNFAVTQASVIGLTVQQKRTILQMRAFNLMMKPTVPNINLMLSRLFAAEGRAWVIDNHNMTMNYFFEFEIPSWLQIALDSFDVLPSPAGVKIVIESINRPAWGFGEFRLNFENGNFGA